MSDGDSISQAVLEQVKDLGSETIKSTVNIISPTNVAKQVIGQVIGKNMTAGEEAKKKKNDMIAVQRIQEIEAEMQRISEERAKLTGPQISDSQTTTNEYLGQKPQQPQDIALKRAQTKVEGDSRANKG